MHTLFSKLSRTIQIRDWFVPGKASLNPQTPIHTSTYACSRHSAFIHRPCYLFPTPTIHHLSLSLIQSTHNGSERELLWDETQLHCYTQLSLTHSHSHSLQHVFERTRSHNLILVFSPQNRNLRHWQNFSVLPLSLCPCAALLDSLTRSSDLHAHAYTLALIQLEEH